MPSTKYWALLVFALHRVPDRGCLHHISLLTSNDSCDYRKIVRNLTLEKP